MIDNDIRAAIIEQCFYDCRGRYKAKHAVSTDHVTIVKQLIDRAENEDRVIISWSEHDYNQMMDVLRGHPDEIALLKKRFRNAIFSAKRWFKQRHPKAIKKRNDLASMMQITAYRVPEKYGTNMVGAALRLLRIQLTSDLKYANLTSAVVRGWRTVVNHNGHDLKGMQHVLITQLV